MQERACKQQATIDDIPVKAGQEISRFHHGRSVHQKSGDKAVVDALAAGIVFRDSLWRAIIVLQIFL